LVHGFSSWLVGSVALGLVSRSNIIVGNAWQRKVLTAWRPGRTGRTAKDYGPNIPFQGP
jgi:hypothetical protein